MSDEPRNPYSPKEADAYLDVWQAVNDHAVARWTRVKYSTGLTETFGPDALLVYASEGELRREDLQIPLSRVMFRSDGEWPTWTQNDMRMPMQPPSEAEIEEAWAATERFRAKRQRSVRRKASPPAGFARKDGEEPDAFYARVADFYKAAAESGNPVSALAEAAGVARNRAGQWVFQARKRGYLPKTTKGRTKA